MAGHALLSASSSHRWLNCPPSARLCEGYEDKNSEYAQEGTDAHSLCEHKLKSALGMESTDPTEGLSFYSEEMEQCACDYAAYVIELVAEAKRICKDPVVLIEQRLDFSRFVQEGFGTGDCVIVADGTLYIVDYKHGKGVEVSAVDNPQMMLYALGALELFDGIYDIDTVQMAIFQPRRDNKHGQKNVQTTKENMVKAKEKIADFKTKRAVKAAEQKKAREYAEQAGSQIRHGTASRPSVPDAPFKGESPQTGASQLIKTRQQGRKTIKTTARNAEKTAKSTAKGTVKAAEKGVKTAKATSKTAIKTTEQTAKAAQKTAKASAKAAQKAAQTAKATAKATAEATKATVRATIAAVKAVIAGTKALVSALIAGGWIAVVIILIVVLLGCAVSLFGGGSDSTSYTPVSAEVEAYSPLIQKYAKQYGIPEYVELIKAVMMQESGGKGSDPMQAAEGSFNKKYPHEPNGIKDPEYSIECGVQELKAALISAEVENPIDMERIKLALQGYNFGNGYISWAKSNYGGYSYANAVEFSTMQAQRLGWEKYGDTQYPAHVLRYYPYGRAFTSGGNQAIVEVALTQLGNEGGQPYWSWYGFDGRVEWCACFVSWCAEQCGYLESGIIPKFSLCSDGVDWFNSSGQWQGKDYEPQTGDLIFFDWGNDGSLDHVGIVEKCENGTVYTVEGNSGDVCKQQSYPVGSSSIYGYGVVAY